MSTTVQAQDGDALGAAMSNVRSDVGGVERKSWALVGHVNNDPSLIDVVDQDCSAEANLADFVEKLQDDQVMYGLIRMPSSGNVRFIYIHWVGDKVPFAKKGKFGVIHSDVEVYFNPYQVMVETGNKDELSEEEIIKKVNSISG